MLTKVSALVACVGCHHGRPNRLVLLRGIEFERVRQQGSRLVFVLEQLRSLFVLAQQSIQKCLQPVFHGEPQPIPSGLREFQAEVLSTMAFLFEKLVMLQECKRPINAVVGVKVELVFHPLRQRAQS